MRNPQSVCFTPSSFPFPYHGRKNFLDAFPRFSFSFPFLLTPNSIVERLRRAASLAFEEKHFQIRAKLNAENAAGGALGLATLRACREIVKSLSL
jgi:hypothetical protein